MIRRILLYVFMALFAAGVAYPQCTYTNQCYVIPPTQGGLYSFSTLVTMRDLHCPYYYETAYIHWRERDPYNPNPLEFDTPLTDSGPIKQYVLEELYVMVAATVLQMSVFYDYLGVDVEETVEDTVISSEELINQWLCDPPANCDQDGDSWHGYQCGGNDCSDTDPTIHPMANYDGDGFFDARCGGTDCRDDVNWIYPGSPYAQECYALLDADCNGVVDAAECGDGDPCDADGDGYRIPSCGGNDCNDDPNLGGTFMYPGSPYATYYCTSGVDADCNQIDDAVQCGTPILISTHGGSIALTSKADGVMFDFGGSGTKIQIPWTRADSDDAWLVLDRNGNGAIDDGTELFGSSTPQPNPEPGAMCNGFSALSMYDHADNGGNGDGVIDSRDAMFARLQLWHDLNHNGVSEPSELYGLSEFGIVTIDLNYEDAAKRDKYGNLGRYRSKLYDSKGSQAGRWAWDVVLNMN